MARIRKSTQQQTSGQQNIWRIGKYIRLSREDGNEVSESVVNQNKILDDELPHFFKTGLFEVVDTYIDDGTSGTTDLERRDFQRMVQDMKDGRINCIIVKISPAHSGTVPTRGIFWRNLSLCIIPALSPCISQELIPFWTRRSYIAWRSVLPVL